MFMDFEKFDNQEKPRIGWRRITSSKDARYKAFLGTFEAL